MVFSDNQWRRQGACLGVAKKKCFDSAPLVQTWNVAQPGGRGGGGEPLLLSPDKQKKKKMKMKIIGGNGPPPPAILRRRPCLKLIECSTL